MNQDYEKKISDFINAFLYLPDEAFKDGTPKEQSSRVLNAPKGQSGRVLKLEWIKASLLVLLDKVFKDKQRLLKAALQEYDIIIHNSYFEEGDENGQQRT